jgi:adenylate cyclase
MFGELVPLGGGDPIPLLKKRLRVGRRDSNDIVLDFGNVSGHHCLLEIEEGYWFIKDLRSRNGVKVSGKKLMANFRKRIDPNVIVTIAKHQYELHYDPADLGAYGTPPQDDQIEEILNESLLERAGLKKKDKK